MIRLTKSLLAGAILSTVCSSAQALIVPVTDYANFSIKIMDDVNRAMEYMKSTGIYQAIDAARSYDTQSRVDAFNNGAANWIARVQQQAADVFNLEQQSKNQPMQDACQTMSVQGSLTDAVCGENGVVEAIREKMGMAETGTLEIYQKAKNIVGSLVPTNIGASTPSAAKSSSSESESDKAYKKFVAEEAAAVDKHMAWIAAGKGAKSTSPTLLLVTSDMAPAYTPEELDMALNLARLTHPPFVRSYGEDPVNDREVVQDMRKKLAIESANDVVARQIAMRTTLDPKEPSKLMALGLPVAIKFDENGEIANDGESWLHKVALNNNTTTTEMTKEKLLMTGLKVNQAIEKYKSQLVTERMILNIYQTRLEKTAKL